MSERREELIKPVRSRSSLDRGNLPTIKTEDTLIDLVHVPFSQTSSGHTSLGESKQGDLHGDRIILPEFYTRFSAIDEALFKQVFPP